MNKGYRILNNLTTDKYGNQKLGSAVAGLTFATSFVLKTVGRSNPVVNGIANAAIAASTAVTAADIIIRTSNYNNDNIQADPDNGSGALDQIWIAAFNTTPKKEEKSR